MVGQHSGAFDMITVIVRNQQSLDDGVINANERESREHLLPAESGVNNQSAVPRVDENGVPLATASENSHANGLNLIRIVIHEPLPFKNCELNRLSPRLSLRSLRVLFVEILNSFHTEETE
jgi:hypothetical protein